MRLIILLAIISCFTITGHASEKKTPVVVGKQFYELLIRLQVRGLPNSSEINAINPFLTDSLKEAFSVAKRINESFLNLKDPDGILMWSGIRIVDMFLPSLHFLTEKKDGSFTFS